MAFCLDQESAEPPVEGLTPSLTVIFQKPVIFESNAWRRSVSWWVSRRAPWCRLVR